MANTYEAIATVTVGSGGAADMQFTSIPGTYTDLCLKISARTDTAASVEDLELAFNSNTASFSGINIFGTGATTGSVSAGRRAALATASSATASTFANSEIYIPNYAGSTNKSYSFDGVHETNATTAYQVLYAGLWSNSAAITSISITGENSGNFVQYSTATLYGIKNS